MSETNPVALAADLGQVLQRYIATTLPISARYPALAKRFRTILSEEPLVKGPFVEALPDFEKGATLDQLLAKNGGFLHDGLGLLPFAARPLHRHQEEALRSAVLDSESLLVATGTGSGKTETFLLPLVHNLLSDPEPDRPGVRALLIYPMNALANDQLYYRIAPLFARYLLPYGITFGRYTGQVKAGVKRVDEALDLLNNGKLMRELGEPRDIPKNWLLTREEMLADPPKVLITNYAMLEHLLLLPRNAPLFQANALRSIVLDEIHTYSGAQATEVAFLLRKLKNRLRVERPLQVFGTSASLSASDDATEDLKVFASRLLGEKVSRVVRGRRLTHAALTAPAEKPFSLSVAEWKQVGVALECFLRLPLNEQSPLNWSDCLEQSGATHPALRCVGAATGAVPALLVPQVAANNEVRAVAALLDQGRVLHFEDLARECFATCPDSPADKQAALAAVVRLGMVVRSSPSDFPLLPARYHLAANGIEGLAVLPSAEGEGWADVRVARHYRGDRGLYFPMLTCRRCGQPYIEGWKHGNRLHTRRPDSSEGGVARSVFWLGQPTTGTEDEEDEGDASSSATFTREWVDPATGELGASERAVAIYPVQTVVDEVEQAQYVRRCPACGGRSNASEAEVVTRMHPGNEALGAVVTQRVLEALPPREVRDWDPKPAKGRSLLTFSDNRQDAAFFAPYVERTAADIALRAGVRQVVKDSDATMTLPQLAERVFDFWHQDGGQPLLLDVFGEIKTERNDVTTLLRHALAREFCTPGGRRNSLESLGVVLVTFDEGRLRALEQQVREYWPAALPSEPAAVRTLIHLLLENVRRDRALASLHNISMNDEAVWGDYNQPRSFELEAGDPNVRFKWLPSATGARHNRRSWYLVERLGLSRDEARTFLARFWDTLTLTRGAGPVMTRMNLGYGLAGELLRYRSGQGTPLYRCASCGLLQRHVLNDCCSAFNCRGHATLVDGDELERMRSQNHYLALYEERNHLTLRAREHTASLSTRLREEVEREFAANAINLLSCTTTMEMGVDLGDLEAVVNLNVPPGVANYQQRTGRAGRRAQAAPFCVTVARNSNYDQAAFRDLQAYLAAAPRTPFVNLANAELFLRHQVSIVLSHLFRQVIANQNVNAPSIKHLFGEEFDSAGFRSFVDQTRYWLESEGGLAALNEAEGLGGLLPDDHSAVPTRGPELRLAVESRLKEFALDVVGRCSDYRQREDAAAQLSKHREAAYWQSQREKFMDQHLVTELSRRGMIPTYSFPVHSLTLEVRDGTSGGDFNREADVALNRDASLGISEYAPGAEVVANGRIWQSAGLAKYPKAFMPTRWYAACPNCYHVDTGDTAADIPASCSNCGADGGRMKRMFVEPKGFVTSSADYRGRDPGTSRRRVRPADEARLIAAPRPEEFEETELDFLRTALLPARAEEGTALHGSLFVANRGAYGMGYNRCLWCDFAEPKKRVNATARRGAAAQTPFPHSDPVTGRACGNNRMPRLGLDFAHRFDTDVRLLRFLSPLPDPEDAEGNPRLHQERLARTLAEAVRHAATDLMSLQPSELRSTYRLYSNLGNTLEVVLYDSVPGGAGYCARLGSPQFSMAKLLERTRLRLQCPRECDSGCRACLCDYGNQRYWDSFERKGALAWLEATLEDRASSTGPGSYLPWKVPSLARLAELFASQPSVSLVGTALTSSDGAREQDLLQLKQWLDSGKTVRVYIAGHVERHPRDYATLMLYRHLHPYASEGRLKVFTVEGLSSREAGDLPRIFGTLEAGSPIVRQGFPLQPLLSGLIAEPAFLGAMDDGVAASARALVDKATACEPNVFAEGGAMQMWEFPAHEPREVATVFAALQGLHVSEMTIRDPYCAAAHNRSRVGQLVGLAKSLATAIKRVVVHAAEIKDRQGYIEHRYDAALAVETIIKGAGVEDCEAVVREYGAAGRGFHDRDVTFEVVKPDGSSERFRYFLTGGVDYLFDQKSQTRVFFARLVCDSN